MSWAAIALGVSAVTQVGSAISTSNQGNRQLDLLERQQGSLQASQDMNMAALNGLLERSPSDHQKESIRSNLRSMGGIRNLIGQFGQIGRNQGTANTGSILDSVLTAARQTGADPTKINAALIQGGREIDEQGQFLTDRGRALIDGRFYDTPVGKEQTKNLFRSMAPGMSIAGREQLGNLGMAAPAGEVDLISQFLMNAQDNARYGDSLLGSGSQIRNMGLGRMGGVLDSAMTTGMQAAQLGQSAASRDIGIGTTQLLNPNDSYRSDALKAGIYASIISGNAAAGGMLGSSASGIVNGMNSSMSSAATGLGTAFSDYAKIKQAEG